MTRMNIIQVLVLLFLLCSDFLGFANTTATGKTFSSGTAEAVDDVAVTRFIHSLDNLPQADIAAVRKTYGDEFHLEPQLLYAISVDGLIDGRRGIVVAYSLGTADGNGQIPIRRTTVITSKGEKVYELEDKFCGDHATVFRLNKNTWALAVGGDDGRPYNGWVRICTLEQRQKLLWSYESPPDIGWYSVIYVIPGDSRIRLVVDRTVRDFTKRSKSNVLELYTLDKKSGTFSVVRSPVNEKSLRSMSQQDGVLQIEQDGIPFDESVDDSLTTHQRNVNRLNLIRK